jgi:hypothetical protein
LEFFVFLAFGVWDLEFFGRQVRKSPTPIAKRQKNVIVEREKSSDCHSERSEESLRESM